MTQALVVFLAVFAGVVAAINITRSDSAKSDVTNSPLPTPTVTIATPKPEAKTDLKYEDKTCGIAFTYSQSYRVYEIASGNTLIINPDDQNEFITVNCQKTREKRTDSPVGEISLASVSAELFADPPEATGTAVKRYTVILALPDTRTQTAISINPAIYEQVIGTLEIL